MERNTDRPIRPAASLALIILWLACFLYLTLASRLPSLPWVVGRSQTVAGPGHFAASFILAALTYGWLRARNLAQRALPFVLGALAASAAIGGIIELLQLLAPSRSPQVSDWYLDLLGAATGALVVMVFDLRREFRHRLVVVLQLGGGLVIALTLSAFAIWPPEGTGPAHIFSSRADYERCDPGDDDTTAANGTTQGERVTDGLTALYAFAGSIEDVSGLEPLLRLELEGDAILSNDALVFREGGGVARSPNPAEKVRTAARAASAFTVEAWVRSASVSQTGPARIVSSSEGTDPNHVNFHLGQEEACLSFRVGTGDGSATWILVDGAFDESRSARHLVATYQAGTVGFFVDGERVDRLKLEGATLEHWDAGYPLLVGNESTLDRPFLGDVMLIAIYGRALTAREVEANYQAGPAG